MEDIKISVIIPIYKVEKYLRQCVESVLNQTYRNIEVILVDDGSPDCCPDICDEYAEKDKRVIVIHKKNGGLSDARNYGIHRANGDYCVFLDSDDFWTDSGALQKLGDRIQKTKVDVLNFAYHKVEEDTGKKTILFQTEETMPANLMTRCEQMGYLTEHSLYVASAWNKLIKTNLLQRIPFDKGKVAEDVEWCARLMEMGTSFDFINENFYCYRQRKGSISGSISEKTCADLGSAIIGCISIMQNCSSDMKEYIRRYSAYQFATFIAIQSFTERFQKSKIAELSKYQSVLKYHGDNKKVRYMYYGSKFFGLNLWCRIIRFTRFVWDSRRDMI